MKRSIFLYGNICQARIKRLSEGLLLSSSGEGEGEEYSHLTIELSLLQRSYSPSASNLYNRQLLKRSHPCPTLAATCRRRLLRSHWRSACSRRRCLHASIPSRPALTFSRSNKRCKLDSRPPRTSTRK